MKEIKRVLKPWGLWNFNAMEAWLEEEAANGWKLTDSLSNWRLKFRRCEPMECRVRMEPWSPETQEEKEERVAAYLEMGWEFSAYIQDGQEYLVYYCTDPEAPELHTDPVARNWAWRKSLKSRLVFQLVCIVAMFFLSVLQVFHGEPVLETILEMQTSQWFLGIVCIPVVILLSKQSLRIYRVLKEMDAGVAPVTTCDWKRERRMEMLLSVMMLAAWLLIMFFPVSLRLFQNQQGYMGVILAEELVEDAEERQWYIGAYRRGRSALANSWFEFEEHDAEIAVETTGYCLRMESLSKMLYRSRYLDFLREYPAVKEEALSGAFDQGVLLSAGDTELLLLQQKNGTYAVRTEGIDLAPHVEEYGSLLARMLEKEG